MASIAGPTRTDQCVDLVDHEDDALLRVQDLQALRVPKRGESPPQGPWWHFLPGVDAGELGSFESEVATWPQL